MHWPWCWLNVCHLAICSVFPFSFWHINNPMWHIGGQCGTLWKNRQAHMHDIHIACVVDVCTLARIVDVWHTCTLAHLHTSTYAWYTHCMCWMMIMIWLLCTFACIVAIGWWLWYDCSACAWDILVAWWHAHLHDIVESSYSLRWWWWWTWAQYQTQPI